MPSKKYDTYQIVWYHNFVHWCRNGLAWLASIFWKYEKTCFESGPESRFLQNQDSAGDTRCHWTPCLITNFPCWARDSRWEVWIVRMARMQSMNRVTHWCRWGGRSYSWTYSRTSISLFLPDSVHAFSFSLFYVGELEGQNPAWVAGGGVWGWGQQPSPQGIRGGFWCTPD